MVLYIWCSGPAIGSLNAAHFLTLDPRLLVPQELDVENFLYLYTLYVVKGRTVTPLLHKLFLGELHRYYSGNNLVRIPFE